MQTTAPLGIDDSERERIRNGLKRYKEQYRIGDPLLVKHISRALNLDIDLSTLQRFLKGKHRTDDIPVHRYRKFLQKVAPPPAGDELAKALKGFLSLSLLMPRHAVSLLAGKYLSLVRPYESAGDGTLADFTSWKKAPPWSSAIFKQSSSTLVMKPAREGFLRVTESLIEGQHEELARTAGVRSGATGILLSCGRREFFMVLRSFDGTRFYMLKKVFDKPLALRGFAFRPESGFRLIPSDASQQPWEPAFEILLARDERQERTAPTA